MEHIVATELTGKELLDAIATRLDGKYKSQILGRCLYRSKSKDPDVSPACGVGLCIPDDLAKELDSKDKNSGYMRNKLVIRPYVQPKDLTADETDVLMVFIQQAHDHKRIDYLINKKDFKRQVIQLIGSHEGSVAKKLHAYLQSN